MTPDFRGRANVRRTKIHNLYVASVRLNIVSAGQEQLSNFRAEQRENPVTASALSRLDAKRRDALAAKHVKLRSARRIPNALKDLHELSAVWTAKDGGAGEGGKDGGSKWQMPSVSSATWPRELRNQTASRTLRVLEYPAGARCDFHLPASPTPLPTSPPLAIALHIPTVRSSGAFANPVTDPRRFIPTDNCISVHCYQPDRADARIRGYICNP